MLTLSSVSGQHFAVLGLGRTGIATTKSLNISGAKVWAWDDCEEARKKAESSGIELRDLNLLTSWTGIECLIVSPGIPHLYPRPHPIIDSALRAGLPLDNDVGLFFSHLCKMSDAPTLIAVTGSNGKSTTAALIHCVLEKAKKKVRLVGNIGEPVLDGRPLTQDEIVILELSSYQIELARLLAPSIAVFLNLSEDHLDRHGGMGGYFAAKRRLFEYPHLKRGVIGVDELEGRYLASRLNHRQTVKISSSQDLSNCANAVFVADGNRIVSRARGRAEEPTYRIGSLTHLSGGHNHQNICATVAVCRALDVQSKTIMTGLKAYQGLPHRSQVVGDFGGIICVNDSKATNVKSAGMALQAHSNIRWISGGLGKEGGIFPLMNHLNNVVKAYLIGQSAQEFANQLGDFPHVICFDLERAVQLACAEALPGDTILLAPAAASFDQYSDFSARGDHFIAEVKRQFGGVGDKN